MTEPKPKRHSHPATRTLAAIGVGAMALFASRVLLDFFGP